LSRLFEIYQDISTLSRLFLGTSGSKISTNWEISIEKNDKINQLLIKREKKLTHLVNLDLDRDFWDLSPIGRVKTRFLDLDFSIVETSFSWLLRLSIETTQAYKYGTKIGQRHKESAKPSKNTNFVD
jgi:hypothetical protein